MRRSLCLLLLMATACARVTAAVPASAPPLRDGVPIRALKYYRLLRGAVNHAWGVRQSADVFGAQIKTESDFDPEVCSKDKLGHPIACGMGQFTVATAQGIAQLYKAELWPPKVLSADWSITALVYHDYDNWLLFPAAVGDNRYGLMLAAYNMGETWLRRERMATLRRGEDHEQWFDGVENSCVRRPSACQETKGYVSTIIKQYRPMFRGW